MGNPPWPCSRKPRWRPAFRHTGHTSQLLHDPPTRVGTLQSKDKIWMVFPEIISLPRHPTSWELHPWTRRQLSWREGACIARWTCDRTTCARKYRFLRSTPGDGGWWGVSREREKSIPWGFCRWNRWQSHYLPSDCSKHPLIMITFELEYHFCGSKKSCIFQINKSFSFFTCVTNQCAKAFTSHRGPNLKQTGVHRMFANEILKNSWLPNEPTLRVLSSLPDTILLPENWRQVITWSSWPFNTCNTRTLRFERWPAKGSSLKKSLPWDSW